MIGDFKSFFCWNRLKVLDLDGVILSLTGVIFSILSYDINKGSYLFNNYRLSLIGAYIDLSIALMGLNS